MRKYLILYLFVMLTTLFTIKAVAQNKPVQPKPNKNLISADWHFNNIEYYLAAKDYALVLKSDSSNAYAMYQLAECNRFYYNYQAAKPIYLKVATRFRDKYPFARYWYSIMLKDEG